MTISISEAERQLEDARRHAAEKERAAAAAAKEAAQRKQEFIKAETARVKELERRVKDAEKAKTSSGVAPLSVRLVARRYLRGLLNPLDLQDPEHIVCSQDAEAGRWYGLSQEAAGLVARLTSFESPLRPGDALPNLADDLELRSYGRFIDRVRRLAGES